MDLGLSGRAALVCGASSGLGLASAEALAEEGANVVLFARRGEQLEEHAARLGGVAVSGDVNEDGDLERAVAIRPGATQLTVMPLGPTSLLSVFNQPVSAGRNVFESARCVVGSWAASEVIATIRPAELRSRCSRQRRTSVTAGRRSSR